jgi:ABC-type transporter Mla MlaB component
MIDVNSEGHFLVLEELKFDTVPSLYKRGCQLISAGPKPIFDLQKVPLSDNAGVTLLISWTRYAKSLGKKILFIHLPKQLLDIIELSGLKAVLPIV